jgi:hypothetical protein
MLVFGVHLRILRLCSGGQRLQVEVSLSHDLRCVLRHQSSVTVHHQSREAALHEVEEQYGAERLLFTK